MRKITKVAAVVLGLSAAIFAVPAWSANDPAPSDDAAIADEATADTDTLTKGRAILEKNCHRCHAIGMEDSSHHEEAPPFRVVVTRYPPENLAEALAEGIVSGHPDMPEFVFQPDEIEAILAYLGSLTPSSETPPEKE